MLVFVRSRQNVLKKYHGSTEFSADRVKIVSLVPPPVCVVLRVQLCRRTRGGGHGNAKLLIILFFSRWLFRSAKSQSVGRRVRMWEKKYMSDSVMCGQ